MAPLVYFDTNVFVYLKEGFGEVPDSLIGLLATAMASGGPLLATCEITLAELLTKPYTERRDDLIDQYDNWILSSDWLLVAAVDRSVLRAAAILRSQYAGIKLPDAIHLAAAIGVGCRYFLTADEGLKRTYRLQGTRYGLPFETLEISIIRPDLETISLVQSQFTSK